MFDAGKVAWQAKHAVRVVTSQICVDQSVRDDIGPVFRGSTGDKEGAGEFTQLVGSGNRHRLRIHPRAVSAAFD